MVCSCFINCMEALFLWTHLKERNVNEVSGVYVPSTSCSSCLREILYVVTIAAADAVLVVLEVFVQVVPIAVVLYCTVEESSFSFICIIDIVFKFSVWHWALCGENYSHWNCLLRVKETLWTKRKFGLVDCCKDSPSLSQEPHLLHLVQITTAA